MLVRVLEVRFRVPPNHSLSHYDVNSPNAAPPVVVLDGEERASLATVRSLVRAGFSVHVTASGRPSLAGAARGATGHRIHVGALDSATSYVDEVARIVRQVGAGVVVPVTDASADAVLRHAVRLPPGVTVPFPSLSAYRAASDKVRVHRFALAAGIGIEETEVVARHGDSAPPASELYPGYIKPHRSVVGDDARFKAGVVRVESREACQRALERLHPAAFPVLVQRRVTGLGEGVFLARWGGRTIARFGHRRLREKPPGGGVSVLRESMVPDPGVLSACEHMLDELEWSGVAMIEGKRDLRTGSWRVMEINGRFWGSLQLAIDAGVDFPSILVRNATGEDVRGPEQWREGLRLRWEWGDLDHLLIRLRRSKETLGLPPEAPGRLGAIRDFLTHWPGSDRLEVFRWSDPMPFVVETVQRMGLAL